MNDADPVTSRWFVPLGPGSAEGGAMPAPQTPAAPRSATWPDAPRTETPPLSADSLFVAPEAGAFQGRGLSARQRVFRLFLGARAALGATVALGQLVLGAFGVGGSATVVALVVAQALAALVAWRIDPFVPERAGSGPLGMRRRVWAGTIGLDLAVFGVLMLLVPGSGPNYGALLVLPVLLAGVAMPRRSALAIAAAVSLGLLAMAFTGAAELVGALTTAGLAGAGVFVVTLLASELASRLEREESSARGSQSRARQEAQINRLVIDEMSDGVLVVDRGGWVRRANPAARALIAAAGAGPAPPFQLHDAAPWTDLVRAVEEAHGLGPAAGEALEATLEFGSGHHRMLRVRPRFTRQHSGRETEELCVLFLEDLRDVQARNRQEKLAAMGRVSAGIAHEIRNPLAAIAQANALLEEDVQDPGQRRLTRMVSDNVERLKRIVDDVLEAAPAGPVDVEPIEINGLVAAVCQDWASMAGVRLAHDGSLVLELAGQATGVHFDGHHLRRVVVNLLDNAHRHSSGRPGGMRLRVYPAAQGEVGLLVVNDGAAISPEVERHLFEPFFSTRSRGSGLGLYICRELCGRYGARIEYRQRAGLDGPRNEFHVLMRRRELTTFATTLPAALSG